MAYNQKEYSGYTSPVPKRSCGRRSTGAKMAYPDTPASMKKKKCDCWDGYSRVPGTKPCAPGSCKKDK